MIQLVAPENYAGFSAELREMHALRYRVFKERLEWAVETREGLEFDRFDGLTPTYLLQRCSCDRIQGCVRLVPTTGPTMLRDVFPELLDGKCPPVSPAIWESSRFAVDLSTGGQNPVGSLALPTIELFAGMIEFGLSRSLIDIVTVTDLRVERILRRASWPLRRIAEPRAIGSTQAIAGYLEVSREALASVRQAGGFAGPVLWEPVLTRSYPSRPSGREAPDPITTRSKEGAGNDVLES